MRSSELWTVSVLSSVVCRLTVGYAISLCLNVMLALRFLPIMFCFITNSLRLVNVALFLPNSGSLQSWKKQENHLRACEEGMLPGGTAIPYYSSLAVPSNPCGE